MWLEADHETLTPSLDAFHKPTAPGPTTMACLLAGRSMGEIYLVNYFRKKEPASVSNMVSENLRPVVLLHWKNSPLFHVNVTLNIAQSGIFWEG